MKSGKQIIQNLTAEQALERLGVDKLITINVPVSLAAIEWIQLKELADKTCSSLGKAITRLLDSDQTTDCLNQGEYPREMQARRDWR